MMTRQLTSLQEEFVVAFTATNDAIGNAAEAARLAGYDPKYAREVGRQLLGKAHVQQAIREANQRQICGALATKAVALLERVIDDNSVPMKVRVEAAKTVLDRGGYGALPGGKPLDDDRHDSELSYAELEAKIR